MKAFENPYKMAFVFGIDQKHDDVAVNGEKFPCM